MYGTTSGGGASLGGLPFINVEDALTAVYNAGLSGNTGNTVYVLPGTYNISAAGMTGATGGIFIPEYSALRGLNVQTVTIQKLNVTQDTTLITMGTNSRIEDLNLKLGSTGHHNLTGIVFGGTTTNDAKMRTSVLTVDNSGASQSGISNVYGINCNGIGTVISPGSFAFNSIKGSTINVFSNGNGIKRGILVSNSNTVTTRDINIFVKKPTGVTGHTGSYVGVETNDGNTGQLGSIQLRSTTVGCEIPAAGETYTASDILQTTPPSLIDPTYLASRGIQIGPSVDLVTKSAGSKPFSTYIYPTTIFYGLRGSISAWNAGGLGATGYCWPGTQSIGNQFPDVTIPRAFYRIQQPSLVSGISASLGTAPSSTHSVTLTVGYTSILTGTYLTTPFVVSLTGATSPVSGTFYNSSIRLNTGDLLHLQIQYTGNNNNLAADLSCQIDLF